MGKAGRWVVSMATAPALTGPWTRYNPADRAKPADAPCSAIAGGIENPIVSRRPDNHKAFHAVYDGSGHPGFGCKELLLWALLLCLGGGGFFLAFARAESQHSHLEPRTRLFSGPVWRRWRPLPDSYCHTPWFFESTETDDPST